jgi:serine-threonine kinase receptor-associated protein
MSQSGGSSPTNSNGTNGGGNLRQIPIVCPGHSRPLAELQYSPVTNDGVFLISACHDKLPMLRRGDTGDWIGTFEGHKGAVWSATIDSSAKYAATGSADFSVKFWNALTGDLLTTFDHKHVVKSVEFLPNGTKLLTAGHEKIVRIFDLEPIKAAAAAGKQIDSTTMTVPIGQLNCKEQIRKVVAINNQIVVTGEVNGTISVWNVETSELIKEFDVGVGIMDMENSRQGKVLTVASGKKVSTNDNSFIVLVCYVCMLYLIFIL